MYEGESRTWGIAARIISARIRSLPEFATARAEVVRAVIAVCRGRDVAAMRELGGFSAVLHATIDALPEAYRVNVGSKLLPTTVTSQLHFDVPSMREEVQWELIVLAEGNGAS